MRSAERDKVLALDAGADDYVVKPFGMQELLARIRAALRRRVPQGNATSFSAGDFAVDFEARQVTVRGRDVHLTPKEFELLRHLISNSGKIVSRKQILEEVWGLHEDTDTRAIDNFIVRLRKYIEGDPSQPQHLLTVRGIGYRFLPKPEGQK